MKKVLAAVVATVLACAATHDVSQIMKTTGQSVTDSVVELAKRTKTEGVWGFWRGYLSR